MNIGDVTVIEGTPYKIIGSNEMVNDFQFENIGQEAMIFLQNVNISADYRAIFVKDNKAFQVKPVKRIKINGVFSSMSSSDITESKTFVEEKPEEKEIVDLIPFNNTRLF